MIRVQRKTKGTIFVLLCRWVMIMTCSRLDKANDRCNTFDVQLLHITLPHTVVWQNMCYRSTPMWQCCPCEGNVKFSFFILKSCLCRSADIQRCEESRKNAQKVTSV